jgi:Protein of unknown function (DUF4238)
MSIPKRHHYVPQFLLKNFVTSDGVVFHFCKDRPELGISRRKPANVFVIGHFNTQTEADGSRNTIVESGLAHIEGLTKTVIDRVISAARAGSAPQLTLDERLQLAIFFAIQHRRTPEARDFANKRRIWTRYLDDVFAEARRRWPQQEQKIVKLETDEERQRIIANGLVHSTLKVSPELVELIILRGLCVFHVTNPDKSLLIGSHPSVRLGNGPLTNPEVEMWLPIASDVAIGLGNGQRPELYIPVSRPDWIRRLNASTAAQSHEFVGNSEELVKSLASALCPNTFSKKHRLISDQQQALPTGTFHCSTINLKTENTAAPLATHSRACTSAIPHPPAPHRSPD